MFNLYRGRLAIKYILFELVPTFIFSVTGFVFLLTMAQTFKLGEYIIVHRAQVSFIGELLVYMVIGTLPMVIPMGLLFAVLLTYGRMSQDSEIVAFKSLGLGLRHILLPSILLGGIAWFMAAQVTMNLAPWAEGRLDVLSHEMRQFRPMSAIREGVFSEGFFDLVVYANKVDADTGVIKKVFIYDERSGSPVTIVAPEGKLVTDTEGLKSKAYLRLTNGDMHRSNQENYTKINFDTYDINFVDTRKMGEVKKDSDTYSMKELSAKINDPATEKKILPTLILERHRRWTIPASCMIFALIAVGLGTVTNRRAAKSGGVVMCVGVVILYWIMYALFENFAQKEILPTALAVWTPNFIFFMTGLHLLRKLAKT